MKDLKSDYFESLTSFHKPIWIRKHKVLTKFHFDGNKDICSNIPLNIEDVVTDDQSETMEVDEKIIFEHNETADENEQIDIDLSFHLEELEVEEESSIENYEIIDLTSRMILDNFLLVLDFNNSIDTD